MKSKSGFTLIEILVVLVVISILVGMSIFAYSQQQAESRNNRRILDAVTLSTEMDAYYQKNGNFPVTCGFTGTDSIDVLSTCSGINSASEFYTSSSMTPPHMIPAGASSSVIQDALPGIGSDFGDPGARDSVPQINHISWGWVNSNSYFLFSPDLIYGGAGELGFQRFIERDGSTLACRYTLETASSPTASKPHQYIIGVPNEVTGSWMFFRSAKTEDRLATHWGPFDSTDSACTPLSMDDL